MVQDYIFELAAMPPMHLEKNNDNGEIYVI